jgi:perosamine synthetase
LIHILEPYLSKNAKKYITDCIDTNWISSQGKYVTQFEKMFRDKFHYSSCATTSNGTTALHLALETLGIKEGDEVIAPDLTFAATINAIIHARATPVIVDIDEKTWNISETEILKNITQKTKAIIVVHLYGNPFDVKSLKEKIPSDIFIIEDCAEAIGAKYNSEYVGTHGDASAFSFFGNKVITTGEGGMVVFKDPKYTEKAKILRDHGMSQSKKYYHEYIGFNYRMTNLQAAIGVSQLESFEEIRLKRNSIFNSYDLNLKKLGFNRFSINASSKESYWLYTALVPSQRDRDSLIKFLKECDIETRPIFYPMSTMNIYTNYTKIPDISISSQVSKNGISLPSSVSLTKDQQTKVLNTISQWCNH